MTNESCSRCQGREQEIHRLRAQIAQLKQSKNIPESDRRQKCAPFVLCACGCEQPTLLATRTHKRDGTIAGTPQRFLKGHSTIPYQRARRLAPSYRIDASGCWVWEGGKNSSGYGTLRVAGVTQQVHRFYYERSVGPIPTALHLDHRCRNRLCVNPDHLEPVTKTENIRRGKVCKLNVDQVKTIKSLLQKGGITQAGIGARFGVGAATIGSIARGESWREIA